MAKDKVYTNNMGQPPKEPDQTSKPALEDDAMKAFVNAMFLRKKMDRQISDNMTNPPFKKGGKVSSASSRADGIAQRGKTRGTMVMCSGGYMKGKK